MSTVFTIADTHFGHKGILNFTTRKHYVRTIDEHDQLLIDNWNATVKKTDVVYLLGDVAWTRAAAAECLPWLKGIKYLVGGNHDVWSWLKHDFNHFYGAKEKHIGGKRLILTHIPVHPQELYTPIRRWDYNIHGHLHDNRVLAPDGSVDKNYLCVSCEQVAMRPVAIEDLIGERT